MGFAFADDVIEKILAPAKGNGRPKAKARLQLDPNSRGCEACPLQETWPNLSTPKIPLHGRAGADLLILGEAPGETEDLQGKPFVGDAGKILDRVLPFREIDRIAKTNAVRCRPPNNRDPVALEMHACSQYLEEDIAKGNYEAILGLGGIALSRFLTEAPITQVHGLRFPVEIAGKTLWYFPTLHPSFVLRLGGEKGPGFPILQNDVKRFFKNVDNWPQPVIEKPKVEDVILAYSEDEARGWCDQLRKAGAPIGLDIETNNLRPNVVGAKILTAAVSNGETTVAWPVKHREAPNDWGQPLLLEMAAYVRWIAHNAAFELAWLREFARRNGWPDWQPQQGFEDSMAAARLYQRRETCLGLGILTKLYTGTNIKLLSNLNVNKLDEEPLEDVLAYNGLDAWGCWRIFKQHGKRVNDSADYKSILESIESVTEMQLFGLDVDEQAANKLLDEWEGKKLAAQTHARQVYEVKQFVRERQEEFNLGSNDQVAQALIEYGNVKLPKTGGGKNFSVDDVTLNKAAPDNPLVKDVLDYRHATKIVSTYIDPVLQAKNRFADQKIHPVYSVMLTKTFRTSCEDPNAQNFPKRKDREVRESVVPPQRGDKLLTEFGLWEYPENCVKVSFDYSQLEARIYGMASKDRALCESILRSEDIHAYWLNVILDEYPEYLDRLMTKVTPNDTDEQIREGGRDIIKSDFVFASFFGTMAKNVAERTGMPLDVAIYILGLFWKRYAGAFAWLKSRRAEYRDSGIARNLCGVERYGLLTGNEPINTPIQSSAARVVLESQNECYQLYRKLKDPHFCPRINIHDDLTFALPDDDELLPVYLEEIAKILTKVRFRWQIVPLKVDAKMGYNWAHMEKVYEFTGDYVR